MKKIIAIAVASVVAAPSFAADITLRGSFDYNYSNTEYGATGGNFSTDAAADDLANTDVKETEVDAEWNLIATSEYDAFSVKAELDYSELGSEDSGQRLHFTGAFGSLVLGDVENAMYTIDELATFPDFKLGTSSATEADHNLQYTLPSFAPGLLARISWAAEDGNNHGLTGKDETGYALQYNRGPFTIGFGATTDNAGDRDKEMFNVGFSAGGVTVAWEQHESEQRTADLNENNNIAGDLEESMTTVQYAFGDFVVGWEAYDREITVGDTTANTDLQDRDMFGVRYSLTDEVTVYFETMDEDESDSDAQAVGVNYVF